MKNRKSNGGMQAMARQSIGVAMLSVAMLLPCQASGQSAAEIQAEWQYSHSGLFPFDYYGAIDYYQEIGVATDPWELSRKPGAMRLDLLFIGDMELEMLGPAPKQRPKGRSHVYGEGFNHVTYYVPDFDGETARLLGKKQWIIFEYHDDNGILAENYLDTREYANIILAFRRDLRSEEWVKGRSKHSIVDWKFRGHGITVPDLDASAKHYDTLKIGTVQPEVMFDSSKIADLQLYGKSPSAPFKARIREVKQGPLTYEFIQPVEGNGIFKESLDRRGEGAIDMTFTVADLKAETAKLVGKGVKVAMSGTTKSGAFAYFDTRKKGGDVFIKLIEEK